MMQIDRSNYESWFLDYLEGRLGEDTMDEFIEFVNRNPDLREELRLFEPVALTAEPLVFKGKNKLYKEPLDLPEEFDHTVVARMEGDLDQYGTAVFDDYLNRHPDKRRDMERFRLTRLEPDLSLQFTMKHRLYRRPVVRELAIQVLRIAAVFFFILAVYALVFQSREKVPDEITNSGKPVFSSVSVPSNADAQEKSGSGAPFLAGMPVKKIPVAHRTRKEKEQADAGQPTENTAYTDYRQIKIPSYLPLLAGFAESGSEQPVLATVKPFGQSGGTGSEYVPEPRYLSDLLIEKLGIKNVSLGKIARSGLDLAMHLTKEKFSYSEDNTGKITAYHLETRLLGLSLPVGDARPESGE